MVPVQPAHVAAPAGFDAVFDAHFDAIFAYLRRRVGEAAEELAAETFARALEGLHRFDAGRGGELPWLYGIATNVLHGHRRTEARRLRAYAREAGRAGPAASGPDLDAQADAACLARDAAQAIRKLSAGDRDALLLVAWAELSYEEAAAALGVPVGTVRSRLHRARAQVRAALDQEAHR